MIHYFPGDTVVRLIWNLMTDLSWFSVAFLSRNKSFLSRNQFRNLFWNIPQGFTGYRAAYRKINRDNFSRLISTFFLQNILAHHLWNILAHLTKFIPTFSLRTCSQGCLGSSQHFF